jgi:hypothetical protein
MATPALELNDTADRRVFAPPPASEQDEAPRYLCFLGSLIEPQTAIERPWTKGGGIEITNPCLRVVQHFIRKGRITPVLMDTHDFLRHDFVKKHMDTEPTQFGYFRRVIPPGYVAPTNEIGAPSAVGDYVGKVTYPGQQMESILLGPENVYENQRRGVLEFKDLKGQPYRPEQLDGGVYTDRTLWEIQRTIFPRYPLLPILLDEIDILLDAAEQHTMIRSVTDTFRESLDQFRAYASSTVQNSHAKMREIAAKTSGYIPRYTAMDLVLLEQLGLARQDREIARSAAAPSTDSELRQVFTEFLKSQTVEKQVVEAQSVPPDQDTVAVTPIVEAEVDAATGPVPSGPVDKNGKPLRGFALNRYNKRVAREQTATNGND